MKARLGVPGIKEERMPPRGVRVGGRGRAQRFAEQVPGGRVLREPRQRCAAGGLGRGGVARSQLGLSADQFRRKAARMYDRRGGHGGRRASRGVAMLVAQSAAAGAGVVARARGNDHRVPEVAASSAWRTSRTTASQSPMRGWRNRWAVGYHGLSVRASCQRQSAA